MNNWKQVFGFTFRNAVKGKGFRAATIGVAVFLCLLFAGINLFFGFSSDSEETEDTGIETIYVRNRTEITTPDFSLLAAMNPSYEGVRVTGIADSEEPRISPTEVIADVNMTEEGALEITMFNSGEETEHFEYEMEEAGNLLGSLFQTYAAVDAGLSQESAAALQYMVTTHVQAMGEAEKSMGQTLFELFAPMILYFIMYMMLLTYGQSIGKSIIAEKSSKLMELLLTSVRPYALVLGKIAAMISVALLQFAVWIGGGVLGFVIGHLIAKAQNPEYENLLLSLFDLMRETGAGSAFSVGAAIVSVLILILGFSFYCIFVGQVTSFVGRPEELSNISGVFVLPMVVSFMLAYLLPMIGVSDWIMTLLRYIPFTGAFVLPADVLLGNVTLLDTIIPAVILLAASCILVYTTGNVYKKKIFA